jgi:hypothetical protein
MAYTDHLEQFFKQQVLEKAAALLSADTNVSLFETVKLQAQVFLPVLKSLKTEIGEERANQIAWMALRKWSHKLFEEIGAQLPGSPKQERQAIYAALTQRFISELETEIHRQEPDDPEFSINECHFADFFREVGEQEARSILVCNMDLDVAAVRGSEIKIDSGARYNEGCEVW